MQWLYLETTHHRWIQAGRSTMYSPMVNSNSNRYPWLLWVRSQNMTKFIEKFLCSFTIVFFQKNHPGSFINSMPSKVICPFFSVSSASFSGIFISSPTSNQSCWQSLDSGAHKPTHHWSSQLSDKTTNPQVQMSPRRKLTNVHVFPLKRGPFRKKRMVFQPSILKGLC